MQKFESSHESAVEKCTKPTAVNLCGSAVSFPCSFQTTTNKYNYHNNKHHVKFPNRRISYLAVWNGDLREDAHHWTDQVKKSHGNTVLNQQSVKRKCCRCCCKKRVMDDPSILVDHFGGVVDFTTTVGKGERILVPNPKTG